jgi:hypothetical protein
VKTHKAEDLLLESELLGKLTLNMLKVSRIIFGVYEGHLQPVVADDEPERGSE